MCTRSVPCSTVGGEGGEEDNYTHYTRHTHTTHMTVKGGFLCVCVYVRACAHVLGSVCVCYCVLYLCFSACLVCASPCLGVCTFLCSCVLLFVGDSVLYVRVCVRISEFVLVCVFTFVLLLLYVYVNVLCDEWCV